MVSLTIALALMASSEDREAAREAERQAREQLREFQTEVRGARSEPEIIRALERIAEHQHDLILRELTRYLTSGGSDVRIAAAEAIGMYEGNADAAEALLRAIDRQEDTRVKEAFMVQVGQIAAPECARTLVNYFRHPDLDIAEQSIIAAGDIRSTEIISALVDLLGELELMPDNEGQDDMGGDNRMPDIPGGGEDRAERKRRLMPVTQRSLQRLTQQNWEASQDWNNWWREARREFEFPEE